MLWICLSVIAVAQFEGMEQNRCSVEHVRIWNLSKVTKPHADNWNVCQVMHFCTNLGVIQRYWREDFGAFDF